MAQRDKSNTAISEKTKKKLNKTWKKPTTTTTMKQNKNQKNVKRCQRLPDNDNDDDDDAVWRPVTPRAVALCEDDLDLEAATASPPPPPTSSSLLLLSLSLWLLLLALLLLPCAFATCSVCRVSLLFYSFLALPAVSLVRMRLKQRNIWDCQNKKQKKKLKNNCCLMHVKRLARSSHLSELTD